MLFPALGILLGIFAAVPAGAAGGTPDPFGNVAAAYLVKVDGREVWARNPAMRLPPGSIVKLMTALLTVERARLGDVAVVSEAASRETGTRLGLSTGDRMPVIDLLAATLMGSANDACHALADHIGGSERGFVSLMNGRAREMGLSGTRFANACGHDDPGLYSTARDIARLAEAAMEHPVLARLAGLVEGEVSTSDGSRKFTVSNRNELVGRYRGARGAKTGYTARAGKCLAAVAERDGRRVLLVLLNAPDRWWKAEEMLDAAFAAPPAASADRAP